MNERIAELIDQATPKETSSGPYGDTVFRGRLDAEKFAELIVKECAELCTDSYHTEDGFGIRNADQRCHDLIKKHFGVE